MDEKKRQDEMNDVIIKNFQAKNPSSVTRRPCGDNCGPCSCPGGNICGGGIGASAETVGYAGGVAGDLSVQ